MSAARDRHQEPADAFTMADLRPTDRVDRSFSAYELTRSDLAVRRGIDNAFECDDHLQAAVFLARQVLQPVRDAFGPLTPNSVYRSQALERSLKRKPSRWISNSQHARGEACDIEVPGVSTLELARWCADNLPSFDQIICERYDPAQGPNSGWVHVSIRPPWLPSWGMGNRRQRLSYIRGADGQFAYVTGFRASA